MTEEHKEEGILAEGSPRKLSDAGDRVEIFWPKDLKYYNVIIAAIGPEAQKRHIDYGDDDKDIFDFSNEKWRNIQV